MLEGQIIITIDLPQRVHKIAGLAAALEEHWPGTVMVPPRPTDVFDDDGSGIVRLGIDLDGPKVVISDRDTGGQIVFPRAALPHFLAFVNGAAQGPVMINADGATTIAIEATR